MGEHSQDADLILPDGMKVKERFLDLITGKFELKSLARSDVSNLQPDIKYLNLRQCAIITKRNSKIGSQEHAHMCFKRMVHERILSLLGEKTVSELKIRERVPSQMDKKKVVSLKRLGDLIFKFGAATTSPEEEELLSPIAFLLDPTVHEVAIDEPIIVYYDPVTGESSRVVDSRKHIVPRHVSATDCNN